MKMQKVAGMLLALGFVCSGQSARAEEGAATIEKTARIIKALAESGAITPQQAEAMTIEARRRALVMDALQKTAGGEKAAPTPGARAEIWEKLKTDLLVEIKMQMAADIRRQVVAELTGAGGPDLPKPASNGTPAAGADPGKPSAARQEQEKPKPRVVRVPYVPESMRREIRDQVKQEVLAQAKQERWGDPGAMPEWVNRFKFGADLRLRQEYIRQSEDNTPAGSGYVSAEGLTRAADLVGPNGNISGVPNVSTQDDYDRMRLRLRLSASMKVADSLDAGLRISTGNTTGPTSTNQTLGQGLNKYALVLDRGYMTYRPLPSLSVHGGRFANPFFSTDLVWSDNLNFEGLAATYAPHLGGDQQPFLTVGWFPLRADNPLQSTSRSLQGLQAGWTWRLSGNSEFKLGAALYNYRGIEGQLEDNLRYGPPSASDYGTRYEYPNGLRSRGNTLFVVNALNDPLSGTTYWGLASGFRLLNLTGSWDIARFDPIRVRVTGDFVKNLAFDRNKILERTGAFVSDGKDTGYMARLLVGHPEIERQRDWNVSLAYRSLGSDAVLDAYTDSDFGLGGTNKKGFILGARYGIDKNTWIEARWLSSQLIDSMLPKTVGSTAAPTKFAVDLLQIDLNARF